MTEGDRHNRAPDTDGRLTSARRAFARRDLAASQAAHTPAAMVPIGEPHGGHGHYYIGDLVNGGIGGIAGSLAVLSGLAGASLAPQTVFIAGLANLLASGLAAGIANYLSCRSQIEFSAREQAREAWEIEQLPEGERAELLAIYLADGYSQQDAAQLVEIQTRDHGRWLGEMMVHELGLIDDRRRPARAGSALGAACILAGCLPLAAYLLGLALPFGKIGALLVLFVVSAVGLFALGAAKVRVTEGDWLASGLEMLLFGGIAAVVAYGVGALLGVLLPGTTAWLAGSNLTI